MDIHSADYKTNWNGLAQTEESALLHVAGHTDEADLKAAADHTINNLRAAMPIDKDRTILEIGCGVGRVGRELAPQIRRWIGCDVSGNMLGHAAKRCQGIPNIDFVQISGYDLAPIPDASVDGVYCTVVFMHLQEWDRYGYVKEAFRVLKPGGRFFCDNANLAHEDGWKMFLAGASFPPNGRPQHLSRCSTEPELRAYLTHAGFKDVAITEQNVWLFATGTKPTQP
jgi:ubiquinone/menaquinone biosynthesis C-methylase UbiE